MTKWLPKQFSLKTLMLLTAALAVLLAVPRQRSLRQQYALRATRAHVFATTDREPQSFLSYLFFGDCTGDQVEGLKFLGVAVSDADASRLASLFPRLRHVNLHKCPAPEQSIVALRRIPNLDRLTVSFTPLRSLDQVGMLEDLRVLDLFFTNVSDVSLKALGELCHLEVLNIVGAQVRGPGLAALRHLPRLRSMTLMSCPIDDHGLEYLKGFPALQSLTLDDTRVTREGVKRLEAELPGLNIHVKYTKYTGEEKKGTEGSGSARP
jgi:Leucine-rich repeat (LRR) protein